MSEPEHKQQQLRVLTTVMWLVGAACMAIAAFITGAFVENSTSAFAFGGVAIAFFAIGMMYASRTKR